MLKIFLLSVFFMGISLVLSSYVRSAYDHLPTLKQEEKGNAQDVMIKAYGKAGLEWTLKGKNLYTKNGNILLISALLQTQKEKITANRAFINRDTLKGYVEGNVQIVGENFYAKTDRANIDLKEGKVWGNTKVILKEEGKETYGESFTVELRPLRIIIKKAKVKLE
ncbi:LPS export ABC transporter periplasmic protein LptC [Hydrogenobacter hydrogenophilus]|uniref:Lipopolysaccharide-assembly, LptC-related n=1 Tax=Hydrogenobacter hydrogenophilus TaxID=35835 RepID=A0A285NUR8_9AQUI|nr:LPS export ABC transporter periplasmic protein LptC [Hydrogenobacter hydrogenophilus]SNZ11626.1 Lipopolysaccharide-assembly, LptC-related [Hydrogenobacter hydrogenophilus]